MAVRRSRCPRILTPSHRHERANPEDVTKRPPVVSGPPTEEHDDAPASGAPGHRIPGPTGTYLVPYLGALRVRDLRRHHIEAMFTEIRGTKQLSPATHRRILATLRSAIRDAVRAGEVAHDHTAHVRLPKAERQRGQWWSADQFWEFVRNLDDAPTGSAAS